MKSIKSIWKCSRLRFYILNALWNYKFWLFCKKLFKTVHYKAESGEYELDDTLRIKRDVKSFTKKRFVGYLFQDGIYLDNPGFRVDDRETWESWKKKGLI